MQDHEYGNIYIRYVNYRILQTISKKQSTTQ